MSRSPPRILNWAGSKARVAKTLVAAGLPGYDCYHEPFLGSGAAFFCFGQEKLFAKAFLSDTNPHVVNMFKSIQSDPSLVSNKLKLHALLDSAVHYASVANRINEPLLDQVPEKSADFIYLLAGAFHSTWYETLSGQIRLSRDPSVSEYKPRLWDIQKASEQLQSAHVQKRDFRLSLEQVGSNDLLFLDPPYLNASEQQEQRGYNSKRFSRSDFVELVERTSAAAASGADVIFCWSGIEPLLSKVGRWSWIGRDAVWVSDGLFEHLRSAETFLEVAFEKECMATTL